MVKMPILLAVASLGITVALVSSTALAHDAEPQGGIAVSTGTCNSAFEQQWHGYFRTPESDGRPGYKYYVQGVDKLCRHDYAGAIHLFKVAASWGYKPAEYSLGVMYFHGDRVSADRPLGAALMELAAASGIPLYAKVRDLMVKLLTPDEITQMGQLRDQLRPTYGVASLRRARWQWSLAKNAITGSHLGHPVSEVSLTLPSVFGLMPAASMRTPMLEYYRALQQSNDPYQKLDSFLTGRVTVGSLQQLGTEGPGKVGPAKVPAAQQQRNQQNPD